MKRPYLDEWQRLMIKLDTSLGKRLMLAFSWAKLKREISREINRILK